MCNAARGGELNLAPLCKELNLEGPALRDWCLAGGFCQAQLGNGNFSKYDTIDTWGERMIPRVRIHKTNHDKNHHIPNSESVWFQSLGRGLVGGKRRRRKTGTLLEPSWNLAGTSLPSWNSAATLLEVCWNLLGTFLLELCWNIPGTFVEPSGTLLELC
ncbi:unnamed protein product [Cladocopium goreaui]|uniref:Uncharacterized protein n=1 Tax=Cladocopium goreaui TaxID=2562237 RepID=A0A9P1CQG8_9DINO|nr:unnamed protein product [Cladocopium goreaui]